MVQMGAVDIDSKMSTTKKEACLFFTELSLQANM